VEELEVIQDKVVLLEVVLEVIVHQVLDHLHYEDQR
tara:strand:- start:585 stop:692 length:108 start_codon:yes stop_codon:yes gene_type:complete